MLIFVFEISAPRKNGEFLPDSALVETFVEDFGYGDYVKQAASKKNIHLQKNIFSRRFPLHLLFFFSEELRAWSPRFLNPKKLIPKKLDARKI